MRVMNLPELPTGPNSIEECAGLYAARLSTDEVSRPRVSLALTAYVAWPNDQPRRDSFVATYLALFLQDGGERVGDADFKGPRSGNYTEFKSFGGLGAVAKPALDSLIDEITHLQRDWLVVADIFHKTVDIAYDERFQSKGGASISKAIDLCEIERTLPGHSQLRRAWSDFRDVAHLLAASAYLAHEGLNKAAVEASILKSIWIAPDAVLALAGGFQEFGLQPKSIRNASTILPPNTLWRVPPALVPGKPFIPFRRLTEEQAQYLQARRASKKYSPVVAPVRGHR